MELSLKLLDEQALLEQDADLLTSIGYARETGTVFEQNYVLAAQIYSIAEQMIGGEKALNNLAWLMLNGFGIEQNIPRAIELFTKAAEAGDTTAMVNLGNTYEFPLSGEAPDYRRAIRWYKQAAECGNIVMRRKRFAKLIWLFRPLCLKQRWQSIHGLLYQR